MEAVPLNTQTCLQPKDVVVAYNNVSWYGHAAVHAQPHAQPVADRPYTIIWRLPRPYPYVLRVSMANQDHMRSRIPHTQQHSRGTCIGDCVSDDMLSQVKRPLIL